MIDKTVGDHIEHLLVAPRAQTAGVDRGRGMGKPLGARVPESIGPVALNATDLVKRFPERDVCNAARRDRVAHGIFGITTCAP